jgi:hypothetical protein
LRTFILLIIFLFNHELFAQNAEAFNSFFQRFCIDTAFQCERIKYPLLKTNMEPGVGGGYDTSFVGKSQWTFVNITGGSPEHIQIYDNFQKKVKDTDERLVGIYGNESGGCCQLYFKRIDKKWYLIHFQDCSV